jgi:hypothetical protein
MAIARRLRLSRDFKFDGAANNVDQRRTSLAQKRLGNQKLTPPSDSQKVPSRGDVP